MRSGAVVADGKQFSRAGQRFNFRGVTYGTFRPRPDGERFPSSSRVSRDFETMAAAGFTVVRTYTTPPQDVVDLAAMHDLQLLAGVFYPDWRYLIGASKRECRRLARDARIAARYAAERLRGAPNVLGLCVGNEVPADALRWVGSDVVQRVIDETIDVVRDVDPDRLVTYANYPSTEYLSLDSLDFLTFNVFLERPSDFRRYLTRLQHLAADRPLVLGEIGLDSGGTPDGEERQAAALDWQLEIALERGVAGTCVFSWTDEWWVGDAAVEGWHFGLTRADRSARPALLEAAKWNHRTVADLTDDWPSASVVVCAYNAEPTLDECLRHTCALDYPNLEIIVVDDGSTDATAAIARRYPRVNVVSIEHSGLSTARNEGLRAARGDLVVYLDSDAYPSPEWLYYLALGLDGPKVGGVGGPNIPPLDDPTGAQVVARAPGGPVHVLTSDDRAEHVPGCNMAFWREVLQEVGGFDPIYTAAGDDVDLCWKVLDRGWEIGFHPAALVWHHRRGGLGAYLRQQRGYGRAEALVRARHFERFTAIGTARWVGRIYGNFSPPWGRQRVYRGLYGTAAYQSVYRAGGHALDVAHQVGVPVATAMAVAAPAATVHSGYGIAAAAGALLLATLALVDVARAGAPRQQRKGRLRFRLNVAAHHLLQPLARTWGRIRNARSARRNLPSNLAMPGPIQRVKGGVLLIPEDRGRAELVTEAVAVIRHVPLRVTQPTGWEDYDARILASVLVHGDLRTSSHLPGTVQLRVVRRIRWRRLAMAGLILVAAPGAPLAGAGLVVGWFAAADLCLGWWRTGPTVRRALRACSEQTAHRLAAESVTDVREARDDAIDLRVPAQERLLEWLPLRHLLVSDRD